MCGLPNAAMVSARWSSANRNRTLGRFAAGAGTAAASDRAAARHQRTAADIVNPRLSPARRYRTCTHCTNRHSQCGGAPLLTVGREPPRPLLTGLGFAALFVITAVPARGAEPATRLADA